MALSDTRIRTAKPKDKPYKLSDEKGMYLQVNKNGSKYWRLKYRIAGKEKLLALGVYPDVSLKAAREKRDAAREKVAQGIDPSEVKKIEKMAGAAAAENSFASVAAEWFSKRKPKWSATHAEKQERMIERDLTPYLGHRPVGDITSPELLAVLRRVESRGALETAQRAKQVAGQIFRYAVATGRAERDPSADLTGALTTPVVKHLAAVTEPKEVGPLLLMLDGYHGTATVRAALQLAPLTFVRPGELRQAKWVDIDFEAAEWRFHITKTNSDHIVPLSDQAVSILKELYALTGRGEYVFPGGRSPRRPMSNNAVLGALRRLEIPKETMSGHGFRAMARTIMDEVLGFRIEWIEQQLAHAVKDVHGRAYNRTAHLEQRKKMMQAWADYLDDLKLAAKSGNVVTANFG